MRISTTAIARMRKVENWNHFLLQIGTSIFPGGLE
jgi:hypothetical protein